MLDEFYMNQVCSVFIVTVFYMTELAFAKCGYLKNRISLRVFVVT